MATNIQTMTSGFTKSLLQLSTWHYQSNQTQPNESIQETAVQVLVDARCKLWWLWGKLHWCNSLPYHLLPWQQAENIYLLMIKKKCLLEALFAVTILSQWDILCKYRTIITMSPLMNCLQYFCMITTARHAEVTLQWRMIKGTLCNINQIT